MQAAEAATLGYEREEASLFDAIFAAKASGDTGAAGKHSGKLDEVRGPSTRPPREQ